MASPPGQVSQRERRHRRGAQGGQRGPVEEGERAQCGPVEEQVRAGDPGQAARGVPGGHPGDLHAGVPPERGRHQQQFPAGHGQGGAGRAGLGVEPGPQRVGEGVGRPGRGEERGHPRGGPLGDHSRNPVPRSSCGSTVKVCSPVRWAVPVTSVTGASGAVPGSSRPVNSVPRTDSWSSSSPGPSRPSSASSASRAEVPEPQGERSTCPSAKTVTLRWCGPRGCRAAPRGGSPRTPRRGAVRRGARYRGGRRGRL